MTLLNTLSKKNELIEMLESENACLKLKLSARDKEWEEKIKVIHSNIQKRLENGGSPIVVLATVKADIDSLLTQMKEGK